MTSNPNHLNVLSAYGFRKDPKGKLSEWYINPHEPEIEAQSEEALRRRHILLNFNPKIILTSNHNNTLVYEFQCSVLPDKKTLCHLCFTTFTRYQDFTSHFLSTHIAFPPVQLDAIEDEDSPPPPPQGTFISNHPDLNLVPAPETLIQKISLCKLPVFVTQGQEENTEGCFSSKMDQKQLQFLQQAQTGLIKRLPLPLDYQGQVETRDREIDTWNKIWDTVEAKDHTRPPPSDLPSSDEEQATLGLLELDPPTMDIKPVIISTEQYVALQGIALYATETDQAPRRPTSQSTSSPRNSSKNSVGSGGQRWTENPPTTSGGQTQYTRQSQGTEIHALTTGTLQAEDEMAVDAPPTPTRAHRHPRSAHSRRSRWDQHRLIHWDNLEFSSDDDDPPKKKKKTSKTRTRNQPPEGAKTVVIQFHSRHSPRGAIKGGI